MGATTPDTAPGYVPIASADAQAELLAHLRDLLPAAFPDGEPDAGALLASLGLSEADTPSFSFSWPGIEQARQDARAATTATLIPDVDASVNWETARDVLIEGDNLQVLKLLKNGYSGAAKLIYIDPPYNTGETFTYNDNFAVPESEYLTATGQLDDQGNATTSRIENAGRKHAPWLTMMFSRLAVARHLLRRDGVILVSIDDNEVHHLRLLLDAVFGASNFVAQLIWKSKSGGANDSEFVAADHEYILVYARDKAHLTIGLDPTAEVTTVYPYEDERGSYALERLDKQNIRYSKSMDFDITGPEGRVYRPAHKNAARPNATWRWGQSTVKERFGELVFKNGSVYTKNYKKDGALPRSLLVDERFGRTRTGSTELRNLFGVKIFDNPKPTRLLQHLVAVFTEEHDLIVDFFAGSGSTGHAAWKQNTADGKTRHWVLVQAPELPNEAEETGRNALAAGYKTIFDITAERLRRAGALLDGQSSLDQGPGLRVFRTRPTNLIIEPPIVATEGMTGERYVQTALLRADGEPVAKGADPLVVAWEVVLKASSGQLDARVTAHDVEGVVVYEFTPAAGDVDGRLFVCLDAFSLATADALGLSDTDTLILRGDRVDDATTLTLAPRLQSKLVLLERIPREVSL